MLEIADKISLIVCQKCEKREDESDVDFAARLYNVYDTCYDKVFDLHTENEKKLSNIREDNFNF